jgi:hypothetical protein
LIGQPEEPTAGAPRRLVPYAMAGNQSWSRAYSYNDAGNIFNIGAQEFVYDELGRLKETALPGIIPSSTAALRQPEQPYFRRRIAAD